MKNISVTIVGILAIVLSNFFPEGEVQTLIEAIGVIIAWYGRIRRGDINLLGVKNS